MGRILTLARNDAHRILSEMGYETAITFTQGEEVVVVNGLGLVHHLSFDTDGAMVNTKNAHITVSEQALISAGITPRNSNGEVFMRNVLVSFADSTGTVKQYTVKENYADESLGVIVLILGKYAQ